MIVTLKVRSGALVGTLVEAVFEILLIFGVMSQKRKILSF